MLSYLTLCQLGVTWVKQPVPGASAQRRDPLGAADVLHTQQLLHKSLRWRFVIQCENLAAGWCTVSICTLTSRHPVSPLLGAGGYHIGGVTLKHDKRTLRIPS